MATDPGGRRAVHGRVSGKVQGVAFRATITLQAGRLGVSGWVRNTADGDVEFHAEGLPTAVAALLEWCQHGPGPAQVTGVQVEDVPEAGARGFQVRY